MGGTNGTTVPTSMSLEGRRLILALTGGIACYKSAEFLRALVKAGAEVQVVMTEGAAQFITPVTMQALSGHPVVLSTWDKTPVQGVDNHMAHINLTRGADAVLVVPATADAIARMAQGRADDLLSLMCLARPRQSCALLVAPAMNREMWEHPATKRNVAQIQQDGATLMGPASGDQACGEVGEGRMLEPDELLAHVHAHFQPKNLLGKRVLVTAGPTFEALDPVRGITNRSSGKMGFAIARAAQERGAEVTLVAGPVALPTPIGVHRLNVESACEMHAAVMAHLDGQDVFVATAAVADWRAAEPSAQKIKKSEGSTEPPELRMVENPDILAEVAAHARAHQGRPYCVGFAAESHELLAHAQAKRVRKGVPLLVGNIGPATFGQDDNALLLVDESGHRELPRADKLTLARELMAELGRRMAAQASQ